MRMDRQNNRQHSELGGNKVLSEDIRNNRTHSISETLRDCSIYTKYACSAFTRRPVYRPTSFCSSVIKR